MSQALRPLPGHCIRVNALQRLEETGMVRPVRARRAMAYVSQGETCTGALRSQRMNGACLWQASFCIRPQMLSPLPGHFIRGQALQRLEENVYCATCP